MLWSLRNTNREACAPKERKKRKKSLVSVLLSNEKCKNPSQGRVGLPSSLPWWGSSKRSKLQWVLPLTETRKLSPNWWGNLIPKEVQRIRGLSVGCWAQRGCPQPCPKRKVFPSFKKITQAAKPTGPVEQATSRLGWCYHVLVWMGYSLRISSKGPWEVYPGPGCSERTGNSPHPNSQRAPSGSENPQAYPPSSCPGSTPGQSIP